MAGPYETPGIYIEPMQSGSMPIQGVSTSTAAFVGFTEKYDPQEGNRSDPTGVRPQLITSWPQYERTFGGFVPGALLPYAVRGFFDNGGGSCYVVRVENGAEDQPPRAAIPSAVRGDIEGITFRAVSSDAARYEIEVIGPPPPAEGTEPSDSYTFRVFTGGELLEELTGVSFSKSVRVIERTVNDKARFVQLEMPPLGGASPAELAPAPGRYALRQPVGDAADPQDLQGSETARTGYQGLAIANDFTMVAIPDLVTVATQPDGTFNTDVYRTFQAQLVDWCSTGGKCMAILDPPPALDALGAVAWRNDFGRDSAFGTCYYPNVVVPNREKDRDGSRPEFLTVPPSGHIAGVWARTDATRGIWKAPANEAIRGISGLETAVTDGEQAKLNPIGVNCLRSFGSSGMKVWGARTMSVQDQSWRYINVRRVLTFIQESIRQGTQWAVFEPNDRNLWERVKRNVSAFLRGMWREGALVGLTPEQAFYVLCDESNNPQSSIDQGKLVIEIGVAPVKPAEFVIFKIGQWQGGGDIAE